MIKKLMVMALVITLGAGGLALAVQTTDSFDITFSLNGDRGVIVDTTTINIAAGLSPSDVWTSEAIPVLSTGSLANIEYTISGGVASGGTAANLTALEDITPDPDEICLQGQFNGTPSFVATDVITTGAQQVGDADPGDFEGSDNNMDDLGLAVERDLHVRITMPATVTFVGAQTVTVTLTAEEAD